MRLLLLVLAACGDKPDDGQAGDTVPPPETDADTDADADADADTDTDTDTDPLLGSTRMGVGIHHDRAWIRQYGQEGSEDAWTVAVAPEGTFVGGYTTSSWYRTFADPCLDTEHGAPYDCGDAVLFDADTGAGLQLGDLASDEVRALLVHDGRVTFTGRSREATGAQRQGAYVTQYTADLLTEVYDTRMPRAEHMGLARYLDQPYAAGGTLHVWEPDEINAGDEDALVVRLRTDGAIETVQQDGTARFEELLDVAVDAGGVFVTGLTTGYLGADGGISAGAEDGLLLAWSHGLDEADALCRVQLGTTGRDATEGIALWGDFVYVAGNAEGAMNAALPDGGACWQAGADALPDAFVAKYTKACAHVWTRQFGTDLGDASEALAVDAEHVYVVGYARAGVDHVDTPPELTTDGFLRAYTHAGELVGEVIFDSTLAPDDPRIDYARGLTLDDANVYVVGATDGDLGHAPNAGARDIFLAAVPKAALIGNARWDGTGCE